MLDAGRRPMGRLLYWALILVTGFGLSAFGAPVPPQGGVATTTVSDTVYLADECLNASTWAKGGAQTSSAGAPQS
jgi:hypothetical protein